MPKGPWDTSWVVEEELGRGGQGTTYRVSPQTGGQRAVLKLLRNPKNDQARRRMFQEVNNLRLVADAGGAVPRVLDANVDEFEKKDSPLYFVMDFIAGDTLRKRVERGQMSLDQAAAGTLAIARTIEIGHTQGILHRDLKPENIMVRGTDPPDIVLLDYGISFNSESDNGLTRTAETFDNEFLSLPERRVPGSDKRDERSDITSLCAILYYCLTGHYPRDLRNEKGRPPHRRPGYSVADVLKDDPRVPQLELLLDRGFEGEIELRFQTLDDFRNRLSQVLKGAQRGPPKDVLKAAAELSSDIRRRDRTTQIRELQAQIDRVREAIVRSIVGYRGKLSNFIFEIANNNEQVANVPTGMDDLGRSIILKLQITGHDSLRVVRYYFFAQRSQCGMFWSVTEKRGRDGKPQVAPIQGPVLWLDGLREIASTELQSAKDHIDGTIYEMLESLRDEIVSV